MNFINRMIWISIIGIIIGIAILVLSVSKAHAYTFIPYTTVPCDAGTITIGLPIVPGS